MSALRISHVRLDPLHHLGCDLPNAMLLGMLSGLPENLLFGLPRTTCWQPLDGSTLAHSSSFGMGFLQSSARAVTAPLLEDGAEGRTSSSLSIHPGLSSNGPENYGGVLPSHLSGDVSVGS